MSHPPHTKEIILALLTQAEAWISGETMSQALGITRAAVAKHVMALRHDGHAIEAATRRGYRLVAAWEALDGDAVTARLATRVVGKGGWTLLDTTSSTNLVAARLAGEGVPPGHVVLAETQTQGRGRKGCTWFSMPRGLQCSVVLYPDAASWDAERLTHLGAQAVAAAIRECTPLEAVFKVPNDVLIRGRKVAGVLVETGYRGSDPEWAVIGIGCNVNAVAEDFLQAARAAATSLLLELGAPVSRTDLLTAMLTRLDAACEALQSPTPLDS